MPRAHEARMHIARPIAIPEGELSGQFRVERPERVGVAELQQSMSSGITLKSPPIRVGISLLRQRLICL
jgi:hypothetical protein